MKELVVCSGKGGTGKTTVVAALSALAAQDDPHVLADCDVDAANLHLIVEPSDTVTAEFVAGNTAVIDPARCAGCGDCLDLCRFGAIARDEDRTCRVDALACEGCGVCVRFCPVAAIDFPPNACGSWSLSRTARGPLVHAALDIGAENSGKLVTRVRGEAKRLAGEQELDLVLVDGPPGIGCPVTAALTGADLVLLVAEPSVSGLHDLGRILDLVEHFELKAVACVNKHDLSPELTARIESVCDERRVPVLGRIPFDEAVGAAQAEGLSILDHDPECPAALAVAELWSGIGPRLELSRKEHP